MAAYPDTCSCGPEKGHVMEYCAVGPPALPLMSGGHTATIAVQIYERA